VNTYKHQKVICPGNKGDQHSLKMNYRVKQCVHATSGDHVIAVTADFHACIEDETVSQIVRQRTLAATAALTLA